MSETFRSTPSEQQWSAGNGYKSSYAQTPEPDYNESGDSGNEAGKALLVGLLGGLVSAAGYLVYQRLPEDQKERLQSQAKQMLQQRINEIRQNFNV